MMYLRGCLNKAFVLRHFFIIQNVDDRIWSLGPVLIPDFKTLQNTKAPLKRLKVHNVALQVVREQMGISQTRSSNP
jgi:hypothetical protein